jgi:hypothetical protein
MPERREGAILREQPDGAALLEEARRVLLEELLPALPEASRYAARMVASAMAIATREARGGSDEEAALLGALDGDGRGEALSRLCREIRAGDRDPGSPGHDAVRDWLAAYVRLRLAISNPRALSETR